MWSHNKPINTVHTVTFLSLKYSNHPSGFTYIHPGLDANTLFRRRTGSNIARTEVWAPIEWANILIVQVLAVSRDCNNLDE
jgi:hypothetical protein